MNLTRYEPTDLVSGIQEDINKLFRFRPWGRWMSPFDDDSNSILSSEWTPAADIKEEDNQFLIKVDMPGIDAKDIDVSMSNGNLLIKGERESEIKEDKEGYHRVERSYGVFHRSFGLPDTADPEKVSAEVKDGVLDITIGKKKATKAHKITVRSK